MVHNVHNRTPNRLGFTLIELSIVLVIIALILGGIFVGRELIETSKARSVIGAVNEMNSAFGTFKVKFNCLAGDCPNATSLFGTTDENGVTVANGNGNGQLSPFGDTEWKENFQAWLHLSDAKLIPSAAYTGTTGPGHAQRNAIPGVNVPFVTGWSNGLGIYVGYDSVKGHIYEIGTPGMPGANNDCCELMRPAMPPAAAYYIDSKMDNGLPTTGTVWSLFNGWSNGCVSQSNNSIYGLSDAYADTAAGYTINCTLLMKGTF